MRFTIRSCGTSVIKYTLFVFNVIFAVLDANITCHTTLEMLERSLENRNLRMDRVRRDYVHHKANFSGLGILIAGAVVLADVNEFSHFVQGKVTAPPIVLIITGLIIFLIASLGCFGAIKESPTLLLAYALLLAIIFIIELAVGIAASVFKSDLEMMIKTSLQDSIKRSNREDTMAWDNIQRKLMCCGVDYPSDWRTMSANKTLPASCCRPKYIEPTVGHCTESPALGIDKYFQEGCVGKLKQRIEKNAVVLIGVGIGIAFIQILGIVLACYLASTLRRERHK